MEGFCCLFGHCNSSDDARSLLEGVRYPGDGSQTLSYYYTTGTAEYQKAGLYLGRVQKIAFPGSGGTIVSYGYNGAWRPVERKLEIPGVSIRYDEVGVPSSQDYYAGFNRFAQSAFAKENSSDTREWQLSLSEKSPVVIKKNGSPVEQWDHNGQNEMTGRTFGQAPSPEYDMSGNMTKVPGGAGQGRHSASWATASGTTLFLRVLLRGE